MHRIERLKRARNIAGGCTGTKRRCKKMLKVLLDDHDPEALLLWWERYDGSEQEAKRIADVTQFPAAISNLAEIYYQQNRLFEAFVLYRQAAELEDAHALYVLASAHRYGIDGCTQDSGLAIWYQIRAEKAPRWDVWHGYNQTEIMNDFIDADATDLF